MPRHEFTYDPALKETPEWKFLYQKWVKSIKKQCSDAFKNFIDFYNWSMAKGFAMDTKLKRLDDSKPYSPENCLWVHPALEEPAWTEEEMEQIRRWNKTVNIIRCHFGMQPFEQKGES